MIRKTILKNYRNIQLPGQTHPNTCEHKIIAERALGRPLPKGAQVHHVNEQRWDNRNQNLVICESTAYHRLIHARMRILKTGGDPNTQKICQRCKRLLERSEFHVLRTNYDGLTPKCKECNGQQSAAQYLRIKERVSAQGQTVRQFYLKKKANAQTHG